MDDWPTLRTRLAKSAFRSRFRLTDTDRAYIADRGWEEIRAQAERRVREQLAPAHPLNDGAQTPMRGHPVFPAQHATATCCRGCLRKWHGIPEGRPLNEDEIRHVVDTLLAWLHEKTGSLDEFPHQGQLPL